ncbi:MAG: DMT family transporter [Acidimicrobiales bacterium]|nr:DMT family transporter [Acidimicrobiales bacterium]
MAVKLSRFQGSIVILFCGVAFSFGALTFRYLEEANEWQYLFVRGLSAALVSILIILGMGRNPFRSVIEAGSAQIVAGLVMGGLFTLYCVALSRVTAAFVLLIQSTSPFYAAIFARFFLKESLTRDTGIAMFVSLVGVLVMVGGGLEGGDTVGIIVSIVLSVALGGYTVLVRSSPARDPGVPTVVGGTASALVAGVVAGFGPGLEMSGNDIFMGFIGGGILIGAFTPFWNYAHRFVPSADISLLLISEIVAAPLWVWIWVDETPRTETLVGGAICLSAVVWLTLRSSRGKEDQQFERLEQTRALHIGAVPAFFRVKNN